jgi:deoxyribose-phosphate aldolase
MQGTLAAPGDLAQFIDHTLLKADAVEQDIVRLCNEAKTHRFKAVCVNPIFVPLAFEQLKGTEILVASVVGFPLGAHSSAIKALETAIAVSEGAAEIDMVMRIDLAREHKWAAVEDDIATVVRASALAKVKVILETGLLTKEEIASACKASEAAGASFVKTSTGFLGRGASLEDVEIMRASCSPRVKIKASGGIKTFEQAKALIEAGADRLGTSSGVFLVGGQNAAPPSGY